MAKGKALQPVKPLKETVTFKYGGSGTRYQQQGP